MVYLGAEGAAGLHKRIAGYVETKRAPTGLKLALISAAPNLGTATGDYDQLVATIEATGLKPGLIVVDTVAKVIGGADENGAGMAAFLVNAQALAQRFDCFVLAVHHIGWNEEAKDRPRGWSGLPAALDVMILSERREGEMSATLTVQKLKDEPSGVRFSMQMERVVLGAAKTGREVSTLIVDEVTEAESQASASPKKSPAKSARLLVTVITEALDDHGTNIRPFADGPNVKAVAERHVRIAYFKGIAEKAEAGEDADKLYDRQKKSFARAVKAQLDAKDLVAAEHDGERYLYFP